MQTHGRRPPTSDQSRASHSGGQLRLLQGSVRGGRRGLHAESSSTFSSVTDSLLLHKTCRVRRPPLQLRLHSDHSPVHQLQAQGANKYHNQPAGGLSTTLAAARKAISKMGRQKRKRKCETPEFLCVTSGSTAPCCTVSSFLWVCSSCRRSGCRRLYDRSASCTPPAASVHLKTTTLPTTSSSVALKLVFQSDKC